MRNERFFTYVEKHPVARFISAISGWVVMFYFSFVCYMFDIGGSVTSTVMMVLILGLGFWGIPAVIDTLIPNVYRGELVTDNFRIYYHYGTKIKTEVQVNGVEKNVVEVKIKNDIPASIRDYMGIWAARKYELADRKNIYILKYIKPEHMMIFLNDTIIMENDRIYYDRIDRIYGAANKPSTAQPVQQPINATSSQFPVNESIGRTAPITGSQSGNSYTLTALEGQFAGKNWNLDKAVMLGRDGNCCQITFSADTAGVSRVHCEVGYKEGSLYIRDLGSSYGTVLENGSVVNNYQEVKVENNTVFRLNNNEKFMLTK